MKRTNARRMVTFALLSSFVMPLASPPPVAASAGESQACVLQMLVGGLIADRRVAEFRMRDEFTNTLPENYRRDYEVTLYRGNEYLMVGCGCSGATDVDMYLLDDNGNVLARDRERDSAPVLGYSPRWTGQYTLRVEMYETTGGRPPHYTAAILYR